MPADSISRMDSSGSGSGTGSGSDSAEEYHATSEPQPIPGGPKSDGTESAVSQQRFVIPGGQNSSPKIVSMDEIMGMVKNIEDMTLAHEIALNPDFKLTRFEPPENSLEKRVKDLMTKAYWDVLREQLSRDPPSFDHAIGLLGEIKEWLKDVVSKKNKRALDQIYEVLDETVIRQQAEQGVLNFRAYANFVLEIMARSCAPIRDKEIEDISKVDDVVDTFKGIMETLSVMKLDMANTLLSIAKNDVIANSIEYERKKFKEYLTFYTEGFPATEAWLRRNKVQLSQDGQATNGSFENGASSNTELRSDSAFINGYMELMDMDYEHEFPELLKMDQERFANLQKRNLRLCICASALAVVSGLPVIGKNPDFRNSLARELEILMQNVNERKDLADTMENIWLHIQTVSKARLKELEQSYLEESAEITFKNQILQLSKKDSAVQTLFWKRLMTYLKSILQSKSLPPSPPGYTEFTDELERIALTFKRLTSYNFAVHNDYYNEILATAGN